MVTRSGRTRISWGNGSFQGARASHDNFLLRVLCLPILIFIVADIVFLSRQLRMASSTVPTRAQVEVRLASLRDNPVNTADAGENVLAPIYQYLMAIPADFSDGNVHWFCAKAEAVTTGAATFLIRLFAYSSPLVHGWQKRLETCLTGCPACVQGFCEAKSTSRHT
jgi:hypothetical protein